MADIETSNLGEEEDPTGEEKRNASLTNEAYQDLKLQFV